MINFATEQEGYNKAQVDGCIEQIETEYQKLYLENQTLHLKLEQVQEQLEQTWKIITDAKKGLPVSENTEHPPEPENVEKPFEMEEVVNSSEAEQATKLPKAEQTEIDIKESAKPRSGAGRLISNITFYGALAMLLIVVFTYTQSGASRSIFGYSYYNILTTSMQSTLPQGSFILVKETPGEELKVGDDITYFKNSSTIVTHRIIGIYEDYEDSGQYGFQTQGTDNPSPDAYITYEGNVIGKVVYHIPVLGFVMEYIAGNIWMVVIGFALILALSYFLKVVFTTEKPKEQKQESR